MKKLFLISLLISSFFVHSQEVPDPIRAEYLMCNLNDGKTFDDFMKWSKSWNKVMDATDEAGYDAAVMVPRYRTPLNDFDMFWVCLLYTSPSPRDLSTSRMPSSA